MIEVVFSDSVKGSMTMAKKHDTYNTTFHDTFQLYNRCYNFRWGIR